MASSTTSSEEATKGRIGYTECYKVLYKQGNGSKVGNQHAWQDGILTYYTINKKLILRDARGHLLDESFYTSLPQAQSKPMKEEGVRPASIPVGIAFQINNSYIVEVERIKFVHEKFFADGGMREHTPQQRRSRPLPDIFKNVEDILAMKSSETESPNSVGQKRKILESIRNFDNNGTPSKRRIPTEAIDTPSPASSKQSIPTPDRPFRQVGLSKTPRR